MNVRIEATKVFATREAALNTMDAVVSKLKAAGFFVTVECQE